MVSLSGRVLRTLVFLSLVLCAIPLFGQQTGEISGKVTASDGTVEHRYEVWLEPGRPKLFKVDGVRRERLVDFDERPLVCVFMPDRLEVVKGSASQRRAHLDSLVTAFWPTRPPAGRARSSSNSLSRLI